MRTSLAILTLALILVAGCQQETFTRQRFETLYVGQPATDVEAMLGAPTVRDENEWRYVNTMPYAMGTVYFTDGKVTRTTWINERPAATQPATP